MAVRIMGFPTILGAPSRASAAGPGALRARGLVERLEALGLAVIDGGDLPVPAPAPGDDLLAKVVAAAAAQAEAIQTVWRPGDLLLTLGGDHSASLGSVTGLSRLDPGFDLIWVDAHPDFNSPATSPSGFPHGMVLAALAGLVPGVPAVLDPGRILILGAREIDPGEGELLQQAGVRVLPVSRALAEAPALAKPLGPRVFISFDLDSLDPADAPGVGTPAAGGFRTTEAIQLLHTLVAGRSVVGLDVVEYHPGHDVAGRTAEAALAVVAAVLATQPDLLRALPARLRR